MRKFIFTTIILSGLSLIINAQEREWKVFSANAQVTAASPAGDNTWIGTKSGIFKVNSSNQIVAEFNERNSDLPSDNVEALMVAPGGGVYVGTYAAGVIKLNEDGTTDEFPDLNQEINGQKIIKMEPIKGTSKICVLTDSNYLVHNIDKTTSKKFPEINTLSGFSGSWSSTYFKPISDSSFWYADKFHFRKYEGDTFVRHGDSIGMFYETTHIAYGPQGRLWATSSGIAPQEVGYYENGKWHKKTTDELGFQSDIVCMNSDENGGLYIATEDKYYRYQNGSWKEIGSIPVNFWSNKENYMMAINNNGAALFPPQNGKNAFSFDGQKTDSIKLARNNLPEDLLTISTYEDQVFTAASMKNAFYQLQGNSWKKYQIPYNLFSKPDSFVPDNLKVTGENEFWVLNYGEALFRYKSGKWEKFTEQNSAIPSTEISNFKIDSEGNLWMQATNKGVFKFDNGQFLYPDGAPLKLKTMDVALFTIQKGSIWLYDQGDNKLTKWNKHEGFTIFSDSWRADTSYLKKPRFIETAPDGSIWIGTYSPGLSVYKNGKWENPTHLYKNSSTTYMSFKAIDSTTFALGTFQYPYQDFNLQLVTKDSIEWINQNNSPFPHGYHFKLEVTGDKRIVTQGNNFLSILDLEKEDQATVDERPAFNNQLEIFPNPAKEKINLKIKANFQGNANYSIRNINGQVVKNGKLNLASGQVIKSIQIGDLTNGIYLVNIKNQEFNSTHKFIKMK